MDTFTYDINLLTDAQRRRVEALILVRGLFSSSTSGATQFEISRWIITGTY